jgi:hypothetical protein
MKKLEMLSPSSKESVLLKMLRKSSTPNVLDLVPEKLEEKDIELERDHLLSTSMKMLNSQKLSEISQESKLPMSTDLTYSN